MAGTPAAVDSEGVLTEFFAQETRQNYTSTSDQFIEKWKGPYDQMHDCSNGVVIGGVSFIVGQRRPSLNNKFQKKYDPPPLANGMFWKIANVEIEELKPGAHGIVTITYDSGNSNVWTTSGTDGTRETWSIKWQSYSQSVLGYCSYNSELTSTSGSSNSGTDVKDILEVVAGNKEFSELTDIGKAIYQKYVANVNPVFHYPVITHTIHVQANRGSTFNSQCAKELDEVTSGCNPVRGESCPFDSELNDWEFLKVGSDINVNYNNNGSKDTYLTETWWGAKKNGSKGGWDGNFYENGHSVSEYSDDHWQIGAE